MINFEYSKLKKAIPREWLAKCDGKQSDATEQSLFVIRGGDLVDLKNMKTKDFYLLLRKQKKSESMILRYWEHKFRLSADFCWNDVFQFKFKYLKHNRVKQFNLKLLYNLLPLKINLCRWKLANDTSCMFCEEKETLTHLMLTCKSVSNFWIRINIFLRAILNIKLPLTEETLIIGFHIQNNDFELAI